MRNELRDENYVYIDMSVFWVQLLACTTTKVSFKLRRSKPTTAQKYSFININMPLLAFSSRKRQDPPPLYLCTNVGVIYTGTVVSCIYLGWDWERSLNLFY